jgi:hypothetical protein
MDFPDGMRLILAHQQKTSARVRFLRFAHSLTTFQSLPAHSAVLDTLPATRVTTHPAVYLRAAEARLGLASGDLALEGEFHALVDTPHGTLDVRLATFTHIDPPFEAARRCGGHFISLTEARGIPQVELELLRQAYTVLLG